MQVTVKLFGTTRRFSQPGTPGIWQGEIPARSRILDLLEIIGTTTREVSGAAINDVVCPLEAEIPAGAVVILVTPMGAG